MSQQEIRVCIEGIGFMGWMHWLAYLKAAGIEVVAIISTCETKRSGDWTGIKGNFGPPGEKVDLTDIKVYSSRAEALADGDFDVLDVCLPPSMHFQACQDGLNAGKDVFCEKPLTLDGSQADSLIELAEQKDRLLMVGHVLGYIGPYKFLVENREKLGKFVGGFSWRIIGNPTWLANYWTDAIGGANFDLMVHEYWLAHLLLGDSMTTDLRSTGIEKNGFAPYVDVDFSVGHANLHVAGGVLDCVAAHFEQGFRLEFENAYVSFSFSSTNNVNSAQPLTVTWKDGDTEQPECNDVEIDWFTSEVSDVAEAVRTRKVTPQLCANRARHVVRVAEKIAD